MSLVCIHSQAAIEAALDQTACAINRDLAALTEPLVVLVIMKGALVTAGALLPKLTLALELDYVHATRYQNNHPVQELLWLYRPKLNLAGRTVLLVDDILDEGVTLAQVRQYCLGQGAKTVKTMVLVRKERKVPGQIMADYEALTVPDQYVFGFGMDDKELSRNLPGIYSDSARR